MASSYYDTSQRVSNDTLVYWHIMPKAPTTTQKGPQKTKPVKSGAKKVVARLGRHGERFDYHVITLRPSTYPILDSDKI